MNNFLKYIVSLLVLVNPIFCKSLNVGDSQKYNSIEHALSQAAENDTLIVNGGIHLINNLIINKPVTLIGRNNPVLDGSSQNQIMYVKSDHVNVSGFTFQNAGRSFINDNAAIKLDSVSNCTVTNNKFLNNFFAVYLAQTSNSKITGNTIEAFNKRETYSGNGIHLWYCKNILIEGNEVGGHRDGIYFEFVRNSRIEKNISKNNLRYGLHFMFSDDCSYSGNSFIENGAGVAVMFTSHVEMFNNRFEHNWGSASYGILLKEIFDSNIQNNYFYKNSSGIYLEGCNRINVANNDFIENGWAIRLMANSMDNNFEGNNFIGNSFDVTTNNTKNFNNLKNNFWSEYNGYDLDKDGFGDIPHHPVRLFSLIVEQNRPALIFMRSLFIELMDFAERVFPVLTPESLIDSKPLMKKNNHDKNRKIKKEVLASRSTQRN